MNFVVLVVLRSAQPFVRREESARFENLENLLVQSSSVGCVAGCLDGVRAVEGVRLENLADVHEVTLYNLRKVRHSRLLVEFLASSDLVLVDGDPGNVPTSGLDDVAHGTSNAAANVKHLHAGFQADGLRDGWNRSNKEEMKTESLVRQNLHGRKAVCLTGQGTRCGKTKLRLTGLLADDASLEALADFTSREVKALSPAVLIKVGDERVKLVDEIWGAEDPIVDTLAVLLFEELIVGVMPESTRSLAIAPVFPEKTWKGFLRNQEYFTARYRPPVAAAPAATHFTVRFSRRTDKSPNTAVIANRQKRSVRGDRRAFSGTVLERSDARSKSVS